MLLYAFVLVLQISSFSHSFNLQEMRVILFLFLLRNLRRWYLLYIRNSSVFAKYINFKTLHLRKHLTVTEYLILSVCFYSRNQRDWRDCVEFEVKTNESIISGIRTWKSTFGPLCVSEDDPEHMTFFRNKNKITSAFASHSFPTVTMYYLWIILMQVTLLN